MNRRTATVISFGGLLALVGCSWGVREHPMIDAYAAAECVRPSLSISNGQAEWTWRTIFAGEELAIRSPTVADPGETDPTRYPRTVDVRVDRSRGRYYVKMGDSDKMFRSVMLYEHVRNGPVASIGVDPDVLPADCPIELPNKQLQRPSDAQAMDARR